VARTRNPANGRMEDALATLLQNQAELVQNQAAFVAQMRERDREMIEMQRRFARIDERFAQVDQRFAQIDQRFANIEALLREHNRILERLPDAVREKIVSRRNDRPEGYPASMLHAVSNQHAAVLELTAL
jgi:hypothetical protein